MMRLRGACLRRTWVVSHRAAHEEFEIFKASQLRAQGTESCREVGQLELLRIHPLDSSLRIEGGILSSFLSIGIGCQGCL